MPFETAAERKSFVFTIPLVSYVYFMWKIQKKKKKKTKSLLLIGK